MRILHIMNGGTAVGAITSIKKLVNELHNKGEDVWILSYNGENYENLHADVDRRFCDLRFNKVLNNFMNKRISFFVAPFLLIYYFLMDLFLLRQFVKEQKIDIIHTHYLNDNFITTFLSAKVKKVSHIRSIINRGFLAGLGFRLFRNRILNRSDLVIGISNTVLSALDITLSENVKVLYNGVNRNLSLNKVSNEIIQNISKNYPFIVGCVTRFAKAKGLEFLIDIAFECKKQNLHLIFIVVAPDKSKEEAAYKGHLQQLIIERSLEDYIKFVGGFPNVGHFMPYFSILVHPTLQREGFGNVVLEAFEYGKPVICTDCGGPSEIITDGINGFILNGLDPKDFVDKISCFMENSSLYESFKYEAISTAKNTKYDLSSNVDLLIKYYNKL